MTHRLARLRYGQVQRSAMNWPFYVAEALDLFADQGLVVESRIFTRPPDPVAALIDGSLDLINVIPDVALLEMIKGAALKVIANSNGRPQYRLMALSEIENCKGLEGKKIGVNDGRSAEALILRKLLREKALRPGSYELVASGPPPKRCEMLKQALLAATMVTQPFDFVLKEEGCKMLASSIESVPHYPFTVCVVRREDEVNEDFVGFLRALQRAWQWLADLGNRAKAVEILSRSTETPERQVEQTYELYLSPPEPPSFAPTEEGIATMLQLLAESGRLPLPLPPPRRYIDERYFERISEF